MKHDFFWSIEPIKKKKAKYNVIFGERSSGKTYGVELEILKNWIEKRQQGAIIRRMDEDFRGQRGQQMYDALVANNEIEKLTKGEWTGVTYRSKRWYLSRLDEKGKPEMQETPFCFAFSLSAYVHDKSTSYPGVTTVCFDEFICNTGYLSDEFILFQNTLSTIIRQRSNVTIYMLGNTVNKYGCPYFKEMGLTNVQKMKQGTIEVYTYGQTELTVAVEFTGNKKSKDSDVYFAFGNEKLSMITRGSWEINVYPHKPCKFCPKDIIFTYFIKYEEYILQCEIVRTGNNFFTFVHIKTTELKDPDRDLIYSLEYDPRPNWGRRLTAPVNELQKKVAWFWKADKVFYSDNEIGELVHNYLIECHDL